MFYVRLINDVLPACSTVGRVPHIMHASSRSDLKKIIDNGKKGNGGGNADSSSANYTGTDRRDNRRHPVVRCSNCHRKAEHHRINKVPMGSKCTYKRVSLKQQLRYEKNKADQQREKNLKRKRQRDASYMREILAEARSAPATSEPPNKKTKRKQEMLATLRAGAGQSEGKAVSWLDLQEGSHATSNLHNPSHVHVPTPNRTKHSMMVDGSAFAVS